MALQLNEQKPTPVRDDWEVTAGNAPEVWSIGLLGQTRCSSCLPELGEVLTIFAASVTMSLPQYSFYGLTQYSEVHRRVAPSQD